MCTHAVTFQLQVTTWRLRGIHLGGTEENTRPVTVEIPQSFSIMYVGYADWTRTRTLPVRMPACAVAALCYVGIAGKMQYMHRRCSLPSIS